jgi:hypothetical protein
MAKKNFVMHFKTILYSVSFLNANNKLSSLFRKRILFFHNIFHLGGANIEFELKILSFTV